MKYFRFNGTYFLLAILLFLTEVLIEKFVHDTIIRPYVGDLLVVILIYCFVRSFLSTPILPTAIAVLLFAYFIEFLQYLEFIKIIGLENSYWARILLGNYFEWIDMVAYSLGIALVILVEWLLKRITFK